MRVSEILIRAARIENAEVLTRLAGAAKASWGYPEEAMRAWKDALIITSTSITSAPTFVAEPAGREGIIAGFYQLETNENPWSLEHLWVDSEWMRQGIGRALLAHATLFAHSAGIDELAIDADPHAEPFYLSCGAIRVGAIAAPIPGEPDRVRPQLVLRVGEGSVSTP